MALLCGWCSRPFTQRGRSIWCDDCTWRHEHGTLKEIRIPSRVIDSPDAGKLFQPKPQIEDLPSYGKNE